MIPKGLFSRRCIFCVGLATHHAGDFKTNHGRIVPAKIAEAFTRANGVPMFCGRCRNSFFDAMVLRAQGGWRAGHDDDWDLIAMHSFSRVLGEICRHIDMRINPETKFRSQVTSGYVGEIMKRRDRNLEILRFTYGAR